MKLTKGQEYLIKNLSFFKMFSIVISLFGLVGLFLGLYSFFSREMYPDCRPLNFTLTYLSVGIFILGCMLRHAYSLIERLKKSTKDDYR